MNATLEWKNVTHEDAIRYAMRLYPEVMIDGIDVRDNRTGKSTTIALCGWQISTNFVLLREKEESRKQTDDPTFILMLIPSQYVLMENIYYPQAICETVYLLENLPDLAIYIATARANAHVGATVSPAVSIYVDIMEKMQSLYYLDANVAATALRAAALRRNVMQDETVQ